MYKIVIILFCFSCTLFSARDPFNPVSEDVEYSSGFSVRGIITTNGVRACVISNNGEVKTVGEGESVGDVMVIAIIDDKVRVKKDGKIQTLVVK